MGNCCGSESNEVEQHELKSKTKQNKGRVLGGESTTPSDPDSSREARMKAAEKRKQEDENRGVKQGGGKLSQQLMEQNKQPAIGPTAKDPRDDRMVWD